MNNLALLLLVSAQTAFNPTPATPPLSSQPNLAANCGVWQGRSLSVDGEGGATPAAKVTKTIAIIDNVWYQVNEYENADGSRRRVRFVGRPEPGGGVAILSMDRPKVPEHPSIFKPLSATDGVLRSYDQATGREVSIESFSTRGSFRIMTGHSYKWNEDKTEATGVNVVSVTTETRTGPAPTEPLFEFTAADRRRLGF